MYFTSKINGLCHVNYITLLQKFGLLKYKLYNQTNYQLIYFNG